MTHPVREAAPGERGAVAGALAAAFQRDAFASWITPDPDARRRGMREMFDSLLPTAAREGAVLHVTADLEAAALWRPPGAELVFEGPAGARPEVTAAFAAVGAARPAAAHWYLDFLGARHAGQGHGSSLVRHMQSRTDADGIATALWTGDQRNLGFYGHLGYAVVEHLDLGGAGAWWLWRDPPR